MQITIGGQTINLPDWASEATLSALKSSSSANNRLMFDLVKAIKGVDVSAEDVQEVLESLAENQERDMRQQKSNKHIDKFTSTTKDVMGRFSNTEKPLTTMVTMTQDFGEAVFKGTGLLKGMNSNTASAAKGIGGFGSLLGGLTDAGFALAGWNAAKLEQYAAAQEKMIDSGAIFYETSGEFDRMRRFVRDNGVSYTQFTDVINQMGGAMLALGDDVSSGSSQFLNSFSDLNQITDALGDLGMRSNEMMAAYAEYTDMARLTGMTKRDAGETSKLLNRSFVDLMIENTALANLTKKSASEIRKAQMAELTDADVVASTNMFERAGHEASAEIARKLAVEAGLLGDNLTGPQREIYSGIQAALYEEARKGLDGSNMNLGAALGPQMYAVMQHVAPELEDNLRSALKAGDPEQFNMLLKEQLFDRLKDNDIFKSLPDSSEGDSIRAILIEAQKVAIQASKDLAALTPENLDKARGEARNKLPDAGSLTYAMNTLTESFYNVQDAFTVDLDNASKYVESFSEVLKKVSIDLTKKEPGGPAPRMNPDRRPRPSNDPDNPGSTPADRVRPERGPYRPQPTEDTPDTSPSDGSAPRMRPPRNKPNQPDEKPGFPVTVDGNTYETMEAMKTRVFMLNQKMDSLLTNHDPLTTAEQRAEIQVLIDNLNHAIDQRKERGGRIRQDKPYLVGERGPEVVWPDAAGYVQSNKDLNTSIQQRNPALRQESMMTSQLDQTKDEVKKLLDILLSEKENALQTKKHMLQSTRELEQQHKNMLNQTRRNIRIEGTQ